MLKLLIVDDESLTREGLKTSLPWKDLGIDTVLVAGSGREGLSIAEKQKPEIVLTDVRMPQMSGIDMAGKIRDELPGTSIIFMSGYSDKEYLMAAIRFKAVRYVEKPIDLLDLESAVREAADRCRQYSSEQDLMHLVGEAEKEKRLTGILTHTGIRSTDELSDACRDLGCTFAADTSFTAMILKFPQVLPEGMAFVSLAEEIEKIHLEAKRYIEKYGLHALHLQKYEQFLIYFLYGPRPSEGLPLHIANTLQHMYQPAGNPFLAIGRTVIGASRAFQSYNDAVILMQSSFFYTRGSVIVYGTDNPAKVVDTSSYPAEFTDLLSAGNEERVLRYLDNVLALYRNSNTLLPNQVKDDYYKLFHVLENAAHSYQKTDFFGSESILDYLDRANTLAELHDSLVLKTKDYFGLIRDFQPENNTVFAIRDYISRNYKDPMLSVKTIGDAVHRSTSYVCTLFKAETNQTLNQYITEFRIEKAKRLLEDPTSRINEISARVGYTDGNYFGKSFKKYVGLTPSEYREKMLP